jgi:putative tryptophan/tyrosine transport system substrate-binding protein
MRRKRRPGVLACSWRFVRRRAYHRSGRLGDLTLDDSVDQGETMRRRCFLGMLAALIATPAEGWSQGSRQNDKPLIGFLSTALDSRSRLVSALWDGLLELGYVDGQNVRFEFRSAGGQFERLRALAVELINLKPDVLVASAPPAALAFKGLTSTIPVVFVPVSDPVGFGLVDSLAHPGHNFTGVSNDANELIAKQVQFLKELLPTATTIAVLGNPLNPFYNHLSQDTKIASSALKVLIRLELAKAPVQVVSALDAVLHDQPDGMLVGLDPVFSATRETIIEFAAAHRLPTIYPFIEAVREGGLMAYSADLATMYKRAAWYVDKVLHGVKPADLPVEQPTKFEFAINLRTAKALDLTFPAGLIAMADTVIE